MVNNVNRSKNYENSILQDYVLVTHVAAKKRLKDILMPLYRTSTNALYSTIEAEKYGIACIQDDNLE